MKPSLTELSATKLSLTKLSLTKLSASKCSKPHKMRASCRVFLFLFVYSCLELPILAKASGSMRRNCRGQGALRMTAMLHQSRCDALSSVAAAILQ